MDATDIGALKLETSLLTDAAALISRDFRDDSTDAPPLAPWSDGSFAALRARVAAMILRMLEEQPEHLMHVFYRLDLPEARVKDILAESFPADTPGLLADLVITRELEKARTRRMHAASPPSPPAPLPKGEG